MKSATKRMFARTEAGVVIVVLALVLIVGVINPSAFFAKENIIDILRNASYSFVIAAPLTLLFMSSGADMTVGAVTSFGGIVCATCINLGAPWPIAILAAMVCGGLFGLIKSWLIVGLGLTAFICTLGLRYALEGAILVWTRGNPIVGFPDSFKVLGQGSIGGVYWTIIIAIVVGILFHIIITRTKFGRQALAVGGNQETARLAGIKVKRVRFVTNTLVSIAAALVGCLYAAKFNSAQPTIGTGTEMTIMASCIIGGASMGGGSGSMVGTALGVLMLSIIKNGLVLIHLSTYWQNLVFGLVLVASLYVDLVRRKKSASGL